MRAVIGLGNPGLAYAPTRHNLGFWVLERLLGGRSWRRSSHPWGEVFRAGDKLLLRPLTFMNDSGRAVRGLVEMYGLAPRDMLVVYDDVDLPLGEVRLRPGGGAGTHNGMRSVLEVLDGRDLPRLRVGIGPPPAGVDLADYVLSPPEPREVPILARAADRAAELAWIFLEEGLKAALDEYARGHV